MWYVYFYALPFRHDIVRSVQGQISRWTLVHLRWRLLMCDVKKSQVHKSKLTFFAASCEWLHTSRLLTTAWNRYLRTICMYVCMDDRHFHFALLGHLFLQFLQLLPHNPKTSSDLSCNSLDWSYLKSFSFVTLLTTHNIVILHWLFIRFKWHQNHTGVID